MHVSNAPRSSLSPPFQEASRISEVPTMSESSMYSRPSHDLTYYDNITAPAGSAYEDISPPSSPGPEQTSSHNSGQPKRFKSMRDVSPIDENRGSRMAVTNTHSSIPVLRKAPPTLRTGETQHEPSQKFWGGKVAPNSKVKWDTYSGEPSSIGKSGSVSPGTYAKQASTSDQRSLGYHVSVSGPEKKVVSFSERVGRFGSRSPQPDAAPKHEPWSRATGRSEIAPPLKFQPAKAPLQVPRKSLSPTPEKVSRQVQPSLAASVSRAPGATDTLHVAHSPDDLDTHEELIKPTVPLKVGRTTPPRGFTSPTSPTHPAGLGIQAPFKYTHPAIANKQRRNESPDTAIHEQPAVRQIPEQPKRPSTPPQEQVSRVSLEQTPEKDKQAPTSRFSWTTYNSGTTYQHSPPPSPPPALPTSTPSRNRVVSEPISAASAASSILAKRRPVPQPDQTPSRKDTTESPGTAKISTMSSRLSSGPPSPGAVSTFSTASKALPAPPSALTAADHVAVLESQMEDLRIRRSNVYRLLTDLNKAAPPNPLITNFRTARIAEQRKRDFEDELSEIKREEHEVGLLLHRAWRKRERDDPNQAGSAIWIRRVTS